MKINQIKTKTKLLIGASALLAASGAIATPLVCIHSANTNAKGNAFTLSLTKNDLEFYKSQLLSKYAAQLEYDNWQFDTNIDVNKEVGIMLNDMNTFTPRYANDLNEVQKNDQWYLHYTDVGNALGVSVVDTSIYKHDRGGSLANYAKEYAQLDPKIRNNKTIDDYKAATISAINAADDALMDKNEFNSALVLAQKSANLYSSYDYDSELITNALNVLIDAIKTKNLEQNSDLTVQAAFLKNVINYTKTGSLKAGDEIPTNFVGNLCTYNYNRCYGAPLDEFKEDISDVTATAGTHSTEANNLIKLNFIGYNGDGSTFGMAEILPGYTVHLKIDSMDQDTDSHTCKLTLLPGISKTGDANVMWAQATKDDDKPTIEFSLSTNFDEIKYISQNTWYKDISPVTLTSADYDGSTGLYFSTNANARSKIDDIMKGCEIDPVTKKYVLDDPEYPCLMTGQDIAGITAPGDTDKELHTNQFYALQVTNIDYEDSWLQAHWVVADNVSPHAKIVQDIKWKDESGNIFSDICIKYNADLETQNEIKFAKILIDMCNAIGNIFTQYQAIEGEGFESIYDKEKADFWCSTAMLALSVVGAFVTIFDGIQTWVPGAGTWAAVRLGFDIALNVLLVAFGIFQEVVLGWEYTDYETFNDNYNYATTASSKTLTADIQDFSDNIVKKDVENINEELMNIPDRKKSAEAIINTYNSSKLFNDSAVLKDAFEYVSKDHAKSEKLAKYFSTPWASMSGYMIETSVFDACTFIISGLNFAFTIFIKVNVSSVIEQTPKVMDLLEQRLKGYATNIKNGNTSAKTVISQRQFQDALNSLEDLGCNRAEMLNYFDTVETSINPTNLFSNIYSRVANMKPGWVGSDGNNRFISWDGDLEHPARVTNNFDEAGNMTELVDLETNGFKFNDIIVIRDGRNVQISTLDFQTGYIKPRTFNPTVRDASGHDISSPGATIELGNNPAEGSDVDIAGFFQSKPDQADEQDFMSGTSYIDDVDAATRDVDRAMRIEETADRTVSSSIESVKNSTKIVNNGTKVAKAGVAAGCFWASMFVLIGSMLTSSIQIAYDNLVKDYTKT